MTHEPQSSKQADFANMPGANSFVSIIAENSLDQVRYDVFVSLLFKQQPMEFMKLHAALGICGEAGELADAIKKEVIYGKPADRANIVEELGDLRFYIQATMNLYGITEQEVLQQNANKLCVRYKSLRYSDEAAQNRADKEN